MGKVEANRLGRPATSRKGLYMYLLEVSALDLLPRLAAMVPPIAVKTATSRRTAYYDTAIDDANSADNEASGHDQKELDELREQLRLQIERLIILGGGLIAPAYTLMVKELLLRGLLDNPG